MNKPKQQKGFALLSPERRREIAAAGGRRAHELGKAHQFTPDEASAAGKLGGQGMKRKAKP